MIKFDTERIYAIRIQVMRYKGSEDASDMPTTTYSTSEKAHAAADALAIMPCVMSRFCDLWTVSIATAVLGSIDDVSDETFELLTRQVETMKVLSALLPQSKENTDGK